MNIANSTAPRISSIDLVDLINSIRPAGKPEMRHDTFMAKVAKVLGAAAPEFSGTVQRPQPAGGAREYPCYNLPKREAALMVMSESYEVQAKVYDRMTELEARTPAVDPMKILSDPAAMRGLLLNYTEKVIQLEQSVAALEPKAEALDRLATASSGSLCVRDAAKTLQVQERRLRQVLIERRWVYQRPLGAGLLAYADRLQQGFMEHKMTTGEKADGSGWASTQARITAKGMARLAELLSSPQQAAA